MAEPKKKLFGPLELFAFVATVLILGYIGLKKGGISVFEKTESVEITDNPSHAGGQKKVRKYNPSKNEESVENILHQIADQYAGGVADYKVQQQMEDAGMSEDELGFLQDVKNKKEKAIKTESKEDTVDWFALLRSSHKTYSKVKSVFETAGIDVELGGDNLASKLVNKAAANTFYSKLEESFGIPAKEAKDFAEKGKSAVSDWARFVEEKSKE